MEKELKDKIELVREYLNNREGILSAYVFGSYAKEKENKFSDVDIAILFMPSVTEEDFVDRQITIMNDLGHLLNREVDIIVLNRAPTFLKFQVIQTGKRIYEKSVKESRFFEGRSIVEYFDFLPIKSFLESGIIRRVKEVK